MFAKSIVTIAGLAITATFVAGPVNHAAANPLELRGPRIQLHVMPVVPAQPRVAEAINNNFSRVHFDVTNDLDEDQPLQSRDEDDGEEDNLDNIFGEDDPEVTALVDRRNELNWFIDDAREDRDRLGQEFQDGQAGQAARTQVTHARGILAGELASARLEHSTRIAEAQRDEGPKFGPNSEGVLAANAWLTDEQVKLETRFAELVDKILVKEMAANDPDMYEEFLELRNDIIEAQNELFIINEQLDPTQNADAAPENDEQPEPTKKAENTPEKK